MHVTSKAKQSTQVKALLLQFLWGTIILQQSQEISKVKQSTQIKALSPQFLWGGAHRASPIKIEGRRAKPSTKAKQSKKKRSKPGACGE